MFAEIPEKKQWQVLTWGRAKKTMMSGQGIRISNVKGGEPGSLASWPIEKRLGLIVNRGDGLKTTSLALIRRANPIQV